LKQFLLFAGTEAKRSDGVNGLVGDYDSAAEAFVSLVDRQTPSEWWHVLDTQTGEVIERPHLRVSNGMIGFQRSERIVGTKPAKLAIAPAPARKVVDHLTELEEEMRSAVAGGVANGRAHVNGQANGQFSER
jgi:hypothetical protein